MIKIYLWDVHIKDFDPKSRQSAPSIGSNPYNDFVFCLARYCGLNWLIEYGNII